MRYDDAVPCGALRPLKNQARTLPILLYRPTNSAGFEINVSGKLFAIIKARRL